MDTLSLSEDNAEFKRYLFEYRHAGAEWGIEILARSPQEAKERIQALTWARYQGEIQATLHIPTGKSILRRIGRSFGWQGKHAS